MVNPLQKRLQTWSRKRIWADMAKKAAIEAGHDGPVSFDARANVMVFAGMGELAMGELADRLPGMTFPQMEQVIATKVNWFLQYHHPIPKGWSFADSKLQQQASALWWSIDRGGNLSARSMEERARLEQIQGLASWFDRLAAAAHAYAVEGRAKTSSRNHLVIAAQLATELGDETSARSWANEYLDLVSPRSLGALTYRQDIEFLVATAIASGREGLLPFSDLLDSIDGHSHVQNLIGAAQAVEAMDTDSVATALRSARQWKRSIEKDNPHYLVGSDRTAMRVVTMIEAWVEDAGIEVSAVSEPPTIVEITEIISDGRAHAVGWSDTGLVVDGSVWSGDIGVGGSSRVRSETVCGEIESLETRVTLRREDQTVVLLEFEEDEPIPHEHACSPDGQRLALWSDHGPFIVVNIDGSDLRELYGHEDGPNLGAVFAGDRMVSWAGDGQLAVWDLPTRRLHVIDLDGWADEVGLDTGGDFIAAQLRGSWSVFSARTGEQVGPARFASRAVWHDDLATIVLANDESVWLESYSAR